MTPRVSAVLLCGALALAGTACGAANRPDEPPAAAPVQAVPPPVIVTQPPRKAAAKPVAVSIPSIGVRSELVPLHLDKAGALVPPADFVHAGWYAGGPAPGEQGPAVIAGHVDSRRGPAVFFRLRELAPGDEVLVTRADRSTARFHVVEVQRYPKNAFPARRVYMPTPDPALRLITCGGSFDYAKRSYRDNIVVYAVLI